MARSAGNSQTAWGLMARWMQVLGLWRNTETQGHQGIAAEDEGRRAIQPRFGVPIALDPFLALHRRDGGSPVDLQPAAGRVLLERLAGGTLIVEPGIGT
jgi:hypothetical protein